MHAGLAWCDCQYGPDRRRFGPHHAMAWAANLGTVPLALADHWAILLAQVGITIDRCLQWANHEDLNSPRTADELSGGEFEVTRGT